MKIYANICEYQSGRTDDGDLWEKATAECPKCRQYLQLVNGWHAHAPRCKCGLEWTFDSSGAVGDDFEDDPPRTCDTCKWWLGPGEQEELSDRSNHAKCSHQKTSDRPPCDDDGLSTHEGYGGIYTGPKFGCIHHELK